MNPELEFSITRGASIFGNILIFAAYVGLAILLIRLSLQEKKFIGNKTFKLFGAFLTTAAITRIFRVCLFWYPLEKYPMFSFIFGMFDIITGIIAIWAFFTLLSNLTTLKKMPSYKEILGRQEFTHKELERTRKMLEEIKEIEEKKKRC